MTILASAPVLALGVIFAVMVTVGRKSANGLALGTPSLPFMTWVLCPPNNAESPLLRMRANPRLSTPRS